MDLYFKRHDGQAVTCEDFFAAMRDANDADFANFLQWSVSAFGFSWASEDFNAYYLKYNQNTGTPKLGPLLSKWHHHMIPKLIHFL